MIPVKHGVTEVDNMPGEEVEFTLSTTAAALIMQSMADLYSNRTLAIIREYSTNAWDAHVEAGVKKPIAVTLPDVMNPYFVVQDFGTGMTSEELKRIYTTFGDSTKRESNDSNGLLGYGCKSAMAYTNSFTVTAVKNGMKTIAVITRKDDGMMVLKEVLNVPTHEHNGVVIKIPVNNVSEFRTTAAKFYSYWLSGTVEIDGILNENTIIDPEHKIDDDLYESSDGDFNSYVVMGNVAYPINNPETLFPAVEAAQHFVAYVNIGDIEFVPSREALKYTTHTTDKLQSIVDNYMSNVRKLAEVEVFGAATKWDALKASRKWYRILGIKLQFKGEDIPVKIEFGGKAWITNRHWQPIIGVREIDLEKDVLIITEATATVGTYHRNRLHEWWQAGYNPLSTRPLMVYFTQNETWSHEWINPDYIVSWETVKAQTPPAGRPVGAKRKSGTFNVLRPGLFHVSEQTITDPVYWIELKRSKEWGVSEWHTIQSQFGVDNDVVIIPANREDKFKRDFPGAKSLYDHLVSQVDLDGDALYTGDARAYFSLNSYAKNRLSNLDETKIDDPELAQFIRVSKMTFTTPKGYDTNRAQARTLGLPFKQFESDGSAWSRVTKRYPLIEFNSYSYSADILSQKEHVYIYINAVHAARRDGKLT